MKVKNQKTLAKLILTNVKENKALVIYNPALIYYQKYKFQIKKTKSNYYLIKKNLCVSI